MFELKICMDDSKGYGSSEAPEAPEAPVMTKEEAAKRFKELVKGSIKVTDMQRQEELMKVLEILSGEGPESD